MYFLKAIAYPLKTEKSKLCEKTGQSAEHTQRYYLLLHLTSRYVLHYYFHSIYVTDF